MGYVLPLESVTVTVMPDVISEITTVYVPNDRGIRLPETGGVGMTMLITVGGLLCMVALLFYITKRRVSVYK